MSLSGNEHSKAPVISVLRKIILASLHSDRLGKISRKARGSKRKENKGKETDCHCLAVYISVYSIIFTFYGLTGKNQYSKRSHKL